MIVSSDKIVIVHTGMIVSTLYRQKPVHCTVRNVCDCNGFVDLYRNCDCYSNGFDFLYRYNTDVVITCTGMKSIQMSM